MYYLCVARKGKNEYYRFKTQEELDNFVSKYCSDADVTQQITEHCANELIFIDNNIKFKLILSKEKEYVAMKQFAKMQQELVDEQGQDSGNMVGFESPETGQWVINPFMDETLMKEVDPIAYYGEKNITNFYKGMLIKNK